MTPLSLAEEVPVARAAPEDLTPPSWYVDGHVLPLAAGLDVSRRGPVYTEAGIGVLILPCDHCVVDNPWRGHLQVHFGWSSHGLDAGVPWVATVAFVAGPRLWVNWTRPGAPVVPWLAVEGCAVLHNTHHTTGRRDGIDFEVGLGGGVAATADGPIGYPLFRVGIGVGRWTPPP